MTGAVVVVVDIVVCLLWVVTYMLIYVDDIFVILYDMTVVYQSEFTQENSKNVSSTINTLRVKNIKRLLCTQNNTKKK